MGKDDEDKPQHRQRPEKRMSGLWLWRFVPSSSTPRGVFVYLSRPAQTTTHHRGQREDDMLIVWEREERGYVGRSGAKGKQPPTEIARPAS